MSAQPSPRSNPTPHATPRPGSPNRGDGARARLTVAPEVARRRLRARLLMWGAALVTVASLFTLVAFHVFAAQSAFTLERLSKERDERAAALRALARAGRDAVVGRATVIAAADEARAWCRARRRDPAGRRRPPDAASTTRPRCRTESSGQRVRRTRSRALGANP